MYNLGIELNCIPKCVRNTCTKKLNIERGAHSCTYRMVYWPITLQVRWWQQPSQGALLISTELPVSFSKLFHLILIRLCWPFNGSLKFTVFTSNFLKCSEGSVLSNKGGAWFCYHGKWLLNYLFLDINLLCPLYNSDLHFFFFNFLFCYGSLKIVSQLWLGFLHHTNKTQIKVKACTRKLFFILSLYGKDFSWIHKYRMQWTWLSQRLSVIFFYLL